MTVAAPRMMKIIGVAALGLSLAIGLLIYRAQQLHTEAHAEQKVVLLEQALEQVEDNVNMRLKALNLLARVMLGDDLSDTPLFLQRAQFLQRLYPGLVAINRIDPGSTIVAVSPFKPNEGALGRTVGESAEVRQLLETARATGYPAATSVVDLFQGGRGVALYFPLFQKNEFAGYLNVVLSIEAILLDAVEHEPSAIKLKMYDSGSAPAFHDDSNVRYRKIALFNRTWIAEASLDDRQSWRWQEPSTWLDYSSGVAAAACALILYLIAVNRTQSAQDLNGRLQIEGQLRGAEGRYRLLVESIRDYAIYTVDRDGIVKSWSTGAESIYGYAPEEIVGYSVARLLGANSQKLGSSSFLNEGGHLGETLRFEDKCTRKSGEVFDAIVVAATTSVVDGTGSAIIVRDVSKQRAEEQAIQKAWKILDAILDHTVDGLITIDEKGIILSFNKPAQRMFGYAPGEVIGQNVRMLMPEPYRSSHNNHIGAYMTTGQAKVIGIGREARGQRKDGSIFPLDLAIGEVPQMNGGRQFVGTIRDITDRKATEDQLRQAQKMEAIGQLTGGIAHDFNNMLTVIVGNAEMVLVRSDAPDLRTFVDRILAASQGAADLTSRLLAFSRRQSLQPKQIAVNPFLVQVCSLLERTLGEEIKVSLALSEDVWPVMIDQSQLEMAVVNLAINARDAMPKGGQLTIRTENLTIDAGYVAAWPEAQEGDFVMVGISDTGTGMPPEVLKRACEPFFTTKEVGKGSGLGLSMVYGFVKQSGGHVSIHSEVDVGTDVRMYLPRAIGSHPAAEAAKPIGDTPLGTERVLLVEDEKLVREFVESQLVALGYSVIAAEDGVKALGILAGGEKFDLLFTDVVLPGGLSGPDVAAKARQIDPGLRVLFTSAYTRESITQHGFLDPGVHLLAKPYRQQELATKLRQVLDERQAKA